MRNRRLILTGALLLGLAAPAAAGTAQEASLRGSLRNELGVLVGRDAEYATVQNRFDLSFEHGRDRAAFVMNPYIVQQPGEELEIGVREAYLDLYFRDVDIRVGKQQIIWGKAEGVFVTDIVSPKDLRRFLLPDFDEIRIGVTAARFDYYAGSSTVELVWVPVFVPNRQPGPGSLWAPSLPFPVQEVSFQPTVEPAGGLENSELFVKYSYLGSKLDFELMGGYFWDDEPAPHVTSRTPPTVTVEPRHHRLAAAGGGFSAALPGMVLRGEGAYYFGKRFATADPSVSDGVVKKDYLTYAAGVDVSPFGLTASAQLVQEIVPDHDEQMVRDQVTTMVTLLVREDFLHDTLHAEVFSYIGINSPDALVRPRIIYDFADGLELQLGANIFLGSEGTFGQYDANDMLFTRVQYSF